MVDQVSTEALPKGAVLTRIGNQYRVVWNLGDNLGYAWYSIDKEHLENLYETDKPEVDPRFVFNNVGQFEGRFGDYYWGNVIEVSLKAETPWQDLTERVESQFGHVPGLDKPEVQRLLRQAFFEGWTAEQWNVEYRKTDYYHGLTDVQRQWAGKSNAEKRSAIDKVAADMAEYYEGQYGDIRGPGQFKDIAEQVASGALNYETWQYQTRQEAQSQEGTPAFAREFNRQKDAQEPINNAENMAKYAGDQWRDWVGPVNMPKNFARNWGNKLAAGDASEADLENYLKEISTGRWTYKPPNLTWADWSATYKSEIRDELELASLDDRDPLLKKVLGTDLTGMDLTQMIRQDKRFLSTNKMYGELSSAAADMGRKFGFIT